MEDDIIGYGFDGETEIIEYDDDDEENEKFN